MSDHDVPDLSTKLGLISTIDLLEELQSRFDHSIFHGIKARPTDEEPLSRVKMHKWDGDIYTCVALAQEISFTMLLATHQANQDLEQEDI